MIVINIDPVAFSIGPFAVHWFGLMYAVGITIGLLVAWPYAKSKGLTNSQLEKVVYWSVPAGFVGARLYYVVWSSQPALTSIPLSWKLINGDLMVYE